MMLWGASWVSMKVLVTIAPPFTIGFCRFFVAGLFFSLVLRTKGYSPRKFFEKNKGEYILAAGVTGVFGFITLSLVGVRLTSAAQGSIIAGMNPVIVLIFAHIFQKERLPTKWQYSGFIAAFIGIAFVVGIQAILDFKLEYIIGNIIVLLGMVCWGLYTSIAKSAMDKMPPIEMATGSVYVGCLLFAVAATTENIWTLEVLTDFVFWWNVLFLGFLVTFVAYLCYFEAINNLGVTKSGIFFSLVPIFGTTLSFILLNEVPTWADFVGLFFIVLGIVIINLPKINENQ